MSSLLHAEIGIAGMAALYASLRISLFALLLNIIIASPVILLSGAPFQRFLISLVLRPRIIQPIGWHTTHSPFTPLLIACTPPLNNHSNLLLPRKRSFR
ncbi:hypothetical protein C5748_06195 [Phyllobacterium phragmitis]|uniref:Uncharacterized protein n=1 Tax=Phyllobacterium phragmitis TaxID=2670329 RepID=A0A2S9IUI1_9HYPH|nr:hypothetical protein [Phyllobacterium phragmitis]PRD44192.1 hypothetical protein C5748_06195 [Phyllobacterium phragmitis]